MRPQRRLAIKYSSSLSLWGEWRWLFIRNRRSQYDHICLWLLILVLLSVLILLYLLHKTLALLNLISSWLPQAMLLPQHFRMQELFLLLLDYIKPTLLGQHLKRCRFDSPLSLCNTSLPAIFCRLLLLIDRFNAWFLEWSLGFLEWSLDCLVGRLYTCIIDWEQM